MADTVVQDEEMMPLNTDGGEIIFYQVEERTRHLVVRHAGGTRETIVIPEGIPTEVHSERYFLTSQTGERRFLDQMTMRFGGRCLVWRVLVPLGE